MKVSKKVDRLEDLFTDGTSLVSLLQVLFEDDIITSDSNDRHATANRLVACLNFLHRKEFDISGISVDEIENGNIEHMLSLIWLLITHFHICSFPAASHIKNIYSAQKAILLWCRKATEGYPGIDIVDFNCSWRSGHALAAIVHGFRPNAVDFSNLKQLRPVDVVQFAMDAIERVFYIPQLLKAKDICNSKPDDKCILLYISFITNVLRSTSLYENEKSMGLKIKVDNYKKLAHDIILWLDRLISKYQSLYLPNSLIELEPVIVEFDKCFTEDIAAIEQMMHSVVQAYIELENTQSSSDSAIENELSIRRVKKKYSTLKKLQEVTEKKLKAKYDKLTKLKQLHEKVETELSLMEVSLKEVEERLDEEKQLWPSMDCESAQKHCKELNASLLIFESRIQRMRMETKHLNTQDYSESTLLQTTVESAYSQWQGLRILVLTSYIHHIERQQRMVESFRKQAESGNFSDSLHSIQEIHNWLSKKKVVLETASYGIDRIDIQNYVLEHQILHIALLERSPDVKYLCSLENKAEVRQQPNIISLIHDLNNLYERVMNMSAKRMTSLVSLLDFVRNIQNELTWLERKEKIEIGRDWSATDLDIDVLQHYQKDLKSEFHEHQKRTAAYLKIGRKLIKDKHSASKVLELQAISLEFKSIRMSEFIAALDKHIHHLHVYQQFFLDCSEADHWLTERINILNDKFAEIKDDRIKSLCNTLSILREELLSYQSVIKCLCDVSLKVLPLHFRKTSKEQLSIPIRTICSYHDGQNGILNDNEYILLDKSDHTKWTIMTQERLELRVPSLCFLIECQCPEAIESASRLRGKYEYLLQLWKTMYKKLSCNHSYTKLFENLSGIIKCYHEKHIIVNAIRYRIYVSSVISDSRRLISQDLGRSSARVANLEDSLNIVEAMWLKQWQTGNWKSSEILTASLEKSVAQNKLDARSSSINERIHSSASKGSDSGTCECRRRYERLAKFEGRSADYESLDNISTAEIYSVMELCSGCKSADTTAQRWIESLDIEYGYESLIDLLRDSIIRYNQLFLRNLSHGSDAGSISEEIRYQKYLEIELYNLSGEFSAAVDKVLSDMSESSLSSQADMSCLSSQYTYLLSQAALHTLYLQNAVVVLENFNGLILTIRPWIRESQGFLSELEIEASTNVFEMILKREKIQALLNEIFRRKTDVDCIANRGYEFINIMNVSSEQVESYRCVVESMLQESFPFSRLSDHGSRYIRRQIADIRDKMRNMTELCIQFLKEFDQLISYARTSLSPVENRCVDTMWKVCEVTEYLSILERHCLRYRWLAGRLENIKKQSEYFTAFFTEASGCQERVNNVISSSQQLIPQLRQTSKLMASFKIKSDADKLLERWQNLQKFCNYHRKTLDAGVGVAKDLHNVYDRLSAWITIAKRKLDQVTKFGGSSFRIQEHVITRKEFYDGLQQQKNDIVQLREKIQEFVYLAEKFEEDQENFLDTITGYSGSFPDNENGDDENGATIVEEMYARIDQQLNDIVVLYEKSETTESVEHREWYIQKFLYLNAFLHYNVSQLDGIINSINSPLYESIMRLKASSTLLLSYEWDAICSQDRNDIFSSTCETLRLKLRGHQESLDEIIQVCPDVYDKLRDFTGWLQSDSSLTILQLLGEFSNEKATESALVQVDSSSHKEDVTYATLTNLIIGLMKRFTTVLSLIYERKQKIMEFTERAIVLLNLFNKTNNLLENVEERIAITGGPILCTAAVTKTLNFLRLLPEELEEYSEYMKRIAESTVSLYEVLVKLWSADSNVYINVKASVENQISKLSKMQTSAFTKGETTRKTLERYLEDYNKLKAMISNLRSLEINIYFILQLPFYYFVKPYLIQQHLHILQTIRDNLPTKFAVLTNFADHLQKIYADAKFGDVSDEISNLESRNSVVVLEIQMKEKQLLATLNKSKDFFNNVEMLGIWLNEKKRKLDFSEETDEIITEVDDIIQMVSDFKRELNHCERIMTYVASCCRLATEECFESEKSAIRQHFSELEVIYLRLCNDAIEIERSLSSFISRLSLEKEITVEGRILSEKSMALGQIMPLTLHHPRLPPVTEDIIDLGEKRTEENTSSDSISRNVVSNVLDEGLLITVINKTVEMLEQQAEVDVDDDDDIAIEIDEIVAEKVDPTYTFMDEPDRYQENNSVVVETKIDQLQEINAVAQEDSAEIAVEPPRQILENIEMTVAPVEQLTMVGNFFDDDRISFNNEDDSSLAKPPEEIIEVLPVDESQSLENVNPETALDSAFLKEFSTLEELTNTDIFQQRDSKISGDYQPVLDPNLLPESNEQLGTSLHEVTKERSKMDSMRLQSILLKLNTTCQNIDKSAAITLSIEELSSEDMRIYSGVCLDFLRYINKVEQRIDIAIDIERKLVSVANDHGEFTDPELTGTSILDRVKKLNDKVLYRRQCLLNSLKRYETMNKSILECSTTVTVAENYLIQQIFFDATLEDVNRVESNYESLKINVLQYQNKLTEIIQNEQDAIAVLSVKQSAVIQDKWDKVCKRCIKVLDRINRDLEQLGKARKKLQLLEEEWNSCYKACNKLEKSELLNEDMRYIKRKDIAKRIESLQVAEGDVDQILSKILPVYKATIDFFLEYYSKNSIKVIQDKQSNIQRKLNGSKTAVLDKIFKLTLINGQLVRFERDCEDILLWLNDKENLLSEHEVSQIDDTLSLEMDEKAIEIQKVTDLGETLIPDVTDEDAAFISHQINAIKRKHGNVKKVFFNKRDETTKHENLAHETTFLRGKIIIVCEDIEKSPAFSLASNNLKFSALYDALQEIKDLENLVHSSEEIVKRLKNQMAYWTDNDSLPDLSVEMHETIDRFDDIKLKLQQQKEIVKGAYELMKQFEKACKAMENYLLKNREYISQFTRFGISQAELLKQEKAIQTHVQEYKDKRSTIQLVDNLANQFVADYPCEDSKKFKARALNLSEQYEKVMSNYTYKLEHLQRYSSSLMEFEELATQIFSVLDSADMFLDGSTFDNVNDLSSWIADINKCKISLQHDNDALHKCEHHLKTLTEIDSFSGSRLQSKVQGMKERRQYTIRTLESEYNKYSRVISLYKDYSLNMIKLISWMDIAENTLDTVSNSSTDANDQSQIEKLTSLANEVADNSLILAESQRCYDNINTVLRGVIANNMQEFDDNVGRFNDICEKIKQYRSDKLDWTRNTEELLLSYRKLLQYIEEIKVMEIIKAPMVNLRIKNFEEDTLLLASVTDNMGKLYNDYQHTTEHWQATGMGNLPLDRIKSVKIFEQDYASLLLEVKSRKEILNHQFQQLNSVNRVVQDIISFLEDTEKIYTSKGLIIISLDVVDAEIDNDKENLENLKLKKFDLKRVSQEMEELAKQCSSEYLSDLQLLTDNTEKELDRLTIIISNRCNFLNQSLIVIQKFKWSYSDLVNTYDEIDSSYIINFDYSEFTFKNLPQLIDQCKDIEDKILTVEEKIPDLLSVMKDLQAVVTDSVTAPYQVKVNKLVGKIENFKTSVGSKRAVMLDMLRQAQDFGSEVDKMQSWLCEKEKQLEEKDSNPVIISDPDREILTSKQLLSEINSYQVVLDRFNAAGRKRLDESNESDAINVHETMKDVTSRYNEVKKKALWQQNHLTKTAADLKLFNSIRDKIVELLEEIESTNLLTLNLACIDLNCLNFNDDIYHAGQYKQTLSNELSKLKIASDALNDFKIDLDADNQIRLLQNRFEKLQSKLSIREKVIGDLRTNVQKFKQKYDVLMNELRDFQKDLKGIESGFTSEAIQKSRSKLQGLYDCISDKLVDIADFDALGRTISQQCSVADKEAVHSQIELIQELHASLMQTYATLEDSSLEKLRLAEEFEYLFLTLGKLTSRIVEQLNNYENKLVHINALPESLSMFEHLYDLANDKEDTLIALKNCVKQFIALRNTESNEELQDRLDKASKEYDDVKARIERMRREFEFSIKQKGDYESTLLLLSNSLSEVYQDSRKLRMDIALAGDVVAAIDEVDSLLNTLDGKSILIQTLETIIDPLKTVILESDITQMENEIKKSRGKLKDLEATLTYQRENLWTCNQSLLELKNHEIHLTECVNDANISEITKTEVASLSFYAEEDYLNKCNLVQYELVKCDSLFSKLDSNWEVLSNLGLSSVIGPSQNTFCTLKGRMDDINVAIQDRMEQIKNRRELVQYINGGLSTICDEIGIIEQQIIHSDDMKMRADDLEKMLKANEDLLTSVGVQRTSFTDILKNIDSLSESSIDSDVLSISNSTPPISRKLDELESTCQKRLIIIKEQLEKSKDFESYYLLLSESCEKVMKLDVMKSQLASIDMNQAFDYLNNCEFAKRFLLDCNGYLENMVDIAELLNCKEDSSCLSIKVKESKNRLNELNKIILDRQRKLNDIIASSKNLDEFLRNIYDQLDLASEKITKSSQFGKNFLETDQNLSYCKEIYNNLENCGGLIVQLEMMLKDSSDSSTSISMLPIWNRLQVARKKHEDMTKVVSERKKSLEDCCVIMQMLENLVARLVELHGHLSSTKVVQLGITDITTDAIDNCIAECKEIDTLLASCEDVNERAEGFLDKLAAICPVNVTTSISGEIDSIRNKIIDIKANKTVKEKELKDKRRIIRALNDKIRDFYSWISIIQLQINQTDPIGLEVKTIENQYNNLRIMLQDCNQRQQSLSSLESSKSDIETKCNHEDQEKLALKIDELTSSYKDTCEAVSSRSDVFKIALDAAERFQECYNLLERIIDKIEAEDICTVDIALVPNEDVNNYIDSCIVNENLMKSNQSTVDRMRASANQLIKINPEGVSLLINQKADEIRSRFTDMESTIMDLKQNLEWKRDQVNLFNKSTKQLQTWLDQLESRKESEQIDLNPDDVDKFLVKNKELLDDISKGEENVMQLRKIVSDIKSKASEREMNVIKLQSERIHNRYSGLQHIVRKNDDEIRGIKFAMLEFQTSRQSLHELCNDAEKDVAKIEVETVDMELFSSYIARCETALASLVVYQDLTNNMIINIKKMVGRKISTNPSFLRKIVQDANDRVRKLIDLVNLKKDVLMERQRDVTEINERLKSLNSRIIMLNNDLDAIMFVGVTVDDIQSSGYHLTEIHDQLLPIENSIGAVKDKLNEITVTTSKEITKEFQSDIEFIDAEYGKLKHRLKSKDHLVKSALQAAKQFEKSYCELDGFNKNISQENILKIDLSSIRLKELKEASLKCSKIKDLQSEYVIILTEAQKSAEKLMEMNSEDSKGIIREKLNSVVEGFEALRQDVEFRQKSLFTKGELYEKLDKNLNMFDTWQFRVREKLLKLQTVGVESDSILQNSRLMEEVKEEVIHERNNVAEIESIGDNMITLCSGENLINVKRMISKMKENYAQLMEIVTTKENKLKELKTALDFYINCLAAVKESYADIESSRIINLTIEAVDINATHEYIVSCQELENKINHHMALHEKLEIITEQVVKLNPYHLSSHIMQEPERSKNKIREINSSLKVNKQALQERLKCYEAYIKNISDVNSWLDSLSDELLLDQTIGITSETIAKSLNDLGTLLVEIDGYHSVLQAIEDSFNKQMPFLTQINSSKINQEVQETWNRYFALRMKALEERQQASKVMVMCKHFEEVYDKLYNIYESLKAAAISEVIVKDLAITEVESYHATCMELQSNLNHNEYLLSEVDHAALQLAAFNEKEASQLFEKVKILKENTMEIGKAIQEKGIELKTKYDSISRFDLSIKELKDLQYEINKNLPGKELIGFDILEIEGNLFEQRIILDKIQRQDTLLAKIEEMHNSVIQNVPESEVADVKLKLQAAKDNSLKLTAVINQRGYDLESGKVAADRIKESLEKVSQSCRLVELCGVVGIDVEIIRMEDIRSYIDRCQQCHKQFMIGDDALSVASENMDMLSSLNSANYPQPKYDQFLQFKNKLFSLRDQVRLKESELKERLRDFEFIDISIDEINKWCTKTSSSLIDLLNEIEIDQVQPKLSYLRKLSDELCTHEESINQLQKLNKKLIARTLDQQKSGNLSILHYVKSKVDSIFEAIKEREKKLIKGEEMVLLLTRQYKEVKQKCQDIKCGPFLTVKLFDVNKVEIEKLLSDYKELQTLVSIIESDIKAMSENTATLLDVNFDKDAQYFHEKISELTSEAGNVNSTLNAKYVNLKQKEQTMQNSYEIVQDFQSKISGLEKVVEAPVTAVTAGELTKDLVELQFAAEEIESWKDQFNELDSIGSKLVTYSDIDSKRLTAEVSNLRNKFTNFDDMISERKKKLEEYSLRAKEFENSYNELNTLCENPTITQLADVNIVSVDSEVVESCLAEFEEFEKSFIVYDEIAEEAEANAKLFSDASQLVHPFQNKVEGLKNRAHDIRAMLTDKKNLLKEKSNRIRQFDEKVDFAKAYFDAVDGELRKNTLSTIDTTVIEECIKAHKVIEGNVENCKEVIDEIEKIGSEITNYGSNKDVVRIQSKLDKVKDRYSDILITINEKGDKWRKTNDAAKNFEAKLVNLRGIYEILIASDIMNVEINSVGLSSLEEFNIQSKEASNNLVKDQVLLTELHTCADQLVKVSSLDVSEDVGLQVADIDRHFTEMRSKIDVIVNELNDKLTLSNKFDKTVQELLRDILSYKDSDTVKDLSVGLTIEEVDQKLCDYNICRGDVNRCKSTKIVVNQIGKELSACCPENDCVNIANQLQEVEENYNDLIKMLTEKEDRLTMGKNVVGDYSESISSLLELCAEVESSCVMRSSDNLMRLRDVDDYETELQKIFKGIESSDETVQKLEEAASELTVLNSPSVTELIENNVSSIKNRLANLLDFAREKYQRVRQYDLQMKDLQDKIQNVKKFLDRIQISAIDSPQVDHTTRERYIECLNEIEELREDIIKNSSVVDAEEIGNDIIDIRNKYELINASAEEKKLKLLEAFELSYDAVTTLCDEIESGDYAFKPIVSIDDNSMKEQFEKQLQIIETLNRGENFAHKLEKLANQLISLDTDGSYEHLPSKVNGIKDRLRKLEIAVRENESYLKMKQEQSQQLDQNLKELSNWLESVNNQLKKVDLPKTSSTNIEDNRNTTKNIENDIKDRGDFISTLTNICDELTENVPQDEKEKIVKEVENLKEQYILTKESSENKKSNVEEAYEVSNDFEEIYKKLNSKCEEIEETELVRQEMAQVKLDESDMCLEKCKELENAIDSNDELLKNLESKIEAVSGKDLEAMSNEMKDKLKRVKDRLEKADKVINTKENLLKDRKDKHEDWNNVYGNAIEALDTTITDYDLVKSVGSSLEAIENNIKDHKLTSQKINDEYNVAIRELESKLDELYPDCCEVDIDTLDKKFAKLKDRNKEFISKCRLRERQLKNGLNT
ncbi:Plectin, partial [Trichoplax sp. H2]